MSMSSLDNTLGIESRKDATKGAEETLHLRLSGEDLQAVSRGQVLFDLVGSDVALLSFHDEHHSADDASLESGQLAEQIADHFQTFDEAELHAVGLFSRHEALDLVEDAVLGVLDLADHLVVVLHEEDLGAHRHTPDLQDLP